MDEFFYWLSVAMQFITGYFYYKIISCGLQPRSGKLTFLLTWIGLSAVSTTVIMAEDTMNITGIIILFFLIMFLLFKGKPLIKVALVVILYPITAGLNFLHNEIGTYLFFSYFTQEDMLQNYIFSTGFYVPVVAFWYVFYRCSKQALMKMKELLDDKAWVIMIVISLASFVGIFTYVYFTPEKTYNVWLAVLACVVTGVGSIRLASYLADGIYADMERKNLQLQKNYYEMLEDNQSQIRKFRHDMNNHLSVVGMLMEKGENEEALDYFKKLSVKLETANRKFCKNSVVNAVLNAKYNELTALNADVFFNISIDKLMLIDDVSLCTIFANTLDNAIEACRKIPDSKDRRVSLKARYTDNGYFSYEIVNSKNNPIQQKKNRFVTDKEDASSHGIGVSSVQGIVSRYGGTMDISYTEDEFKVTVLVG